MKRGFTLIELIFVIIISALIGYYILANQQQRNFYEEVNKMLSDVGNILNNAVMDTVKGYVNGTGGDCSNGTNYLGLSAARAIDCIGWSNAYSYFGPKNSDGKQSYVDNLLEHYGKCKLYLDNSGLDPDEYYMFLDCSTADFNGDDRYKAYIEDKMDNYLKTHFSTIVQRIDRNAISISDKSSGNSNDGMIGALMKK